MTPDDVWPVVIIKDRYNGTYSRAEWTAWHAHQPPEDIGAGDIECMTFWHRYDGLVGLGSTPDEAYQDLVSKYDPTKHGLDIY